MSRIATQARSATNLRPALAVAALALALSVTSAAHAAEPVSATAGATPTTKATTTATGTRIPRKSADLEERVDVWAGGIGDTDATTAEAADVDLPMLPVSEDDAR